jgi:hypothetical protein
MSKPLSLSNIVRHCRERWQALPDQRKPNNNMRYAIADAALAALSVFFMQSASFLAHQRDMELRKRSNNGRTLFGIEKIPSDNQLRNLLDPITPDHFEADFDWVMAEMKAAGTLDAFRAYEGTLLVALDGLTYHSSTNVHCANCSQRQDSQGTTHYYHSAITPVIVKPGSPHVLPLPPEFIVPQDGHEKQDCERAAVKRWLAAHHTDYEPYTVTYLGDDLYANQPGCQLIAETYQQYFVFVCKPDSHVALYNELALLDKIGGVTTQTIRHWNGRYAEISTYRWANQVPLRTGTAALLVNWCELTVTNEATGAVLFHNAWATNHSLTAPNVAEIVQVGRTRWKVENENINVLKNHGYHLEHNFGHGEQHLSTVLFSLNLFAFLVHTAQHLTNEAYRLLRETLAVRRTFFHDLKALTRYIVFDSWEALFKFMLDGLELTIPPPATL